jgi:hypothetical protein
MLYHVQGIRIENGFESIDLLEAVFSATDDNRIFLSRVALLMYAGILIE